MRFRMIHSLQAKPESHHGAQRTVAAANHVPGTKYELFGTLAAPLAVSVNGCQNHLHLTIRLHRITRVAILRLKHSVRLFQDSS